MPTVEIEREDDIELSPIIAGGIFLAFMLAMAAWIILPLGRERLQLLNELRGRSKTLASRLKALEQVGREDRTRHASALEQLYGEREAQRLRETPVAALSDFGGSGARWGALHDAGIRTVSDLQHRVQAGHDLSAIHGVGAVSVQRIYEGLNHFLGEIGADPYALPDPAHAPEPVEHLYRCAAIRAHFQTAIRPTLDTLRQRRLDLLPMSWFDILAADPEDLDRHFGEVVPGLDALENELVRLETESGDFRGRIASEEFLIEFAREHLDAFRAVVESAPPSLPPPRMAGQLADLDEVIAASETERHFEDRIVTPLLERIGLKFERQYPVEIRVGSRYNTVFVDYAIVVGGEIVSIIENKRDIRNNRHLEEARDQAKSYAVELRVASFIVAARQGFWLYELPRHQPQLVARYDPSEAFEKADEIVEAMRVAHQSYRTA